MDSVTVEGMGWSKSVHATMTEQEFVSLYMNSDHGHVYEYMGAKDKERTLRLVYKAFGFPPPVDKGKKK